MPSATCKRCDLTWQPIVPKPRVCPRCKSYYWNEPRKQGEKLDSE